MEMKPHEYPLVPEPSSAIGEALIHVGFYAAIGVWFLGVVTILMLWTFGPK
jgi:hypothetical protein